MILLNPFQGQVGYGHLAPKDSLLLYHLIGHLDYLNPLETEWKVISNNMNGFDGAVFIHNNHMYNLDATKPVPMDIAGDYYVELTTLKNLYIPII